MHHGCDGQNLFNILFVDEWPTLVHGRRRRRQLWDNGSLSGLYNLSYCRAGRLFKKHTYHNGTTVIDSYQTSSEMCKHRYWKLPCGHRRRRFYLCERAGPNDNLCEDVDLQVGDPDSPLATKLCQKERCRRLRRESQP
jgi:hypothetical protein